MPRSYKSFPRLYVDSDLAGGSVLELGATKLTADKAEFATKYRDTIDEWLI